MTRFSGQVAIITGAGDGIGRATARQLAHEGAAVVGVDLPGFDVQETAKLAGEGEKRWWSTPMSPGTMRWPRSSRRR